MRREVGLGGVGLVALDLLERDLGLDRLVAAADLELDLLARGDRSNDAVEARDALDRGAPSASMIDVAALEPGLRRRRVVRDPVDGPRPRRRRACS